MQFKVSLPVANLLIYEQFEFAGATFIPATREYVDEAEQEHVNLDSIFSDKNLSEVITVVSGVQVADLETVTNIQFDIRIDWSGEQVSCRDFDERILEEAIFKGEAVMDLIRVDYCRLDIPQTSPMMAGYIPNRNILAVKVHNDRQTYLIAREPNCPLLVPGLGLELDSPPSPSDFESIVTEQYDSNSLGIRLKRLLRVFGQSFTAFSDDQKILNLIFAIDGLLTPENCNSNEFKSAIGKWLSNDPSIQANARENFVKFYKEVRNPMVHHGKSYSQLGRNRKEDLLYIQRIIARLLLSLSKYRHLEFAEFWHQYK